jgi:dipeptidyl aminopeptidase/acylaminoacyl peptidase
MSINVKSMSRAFLLLAIASLPLAALAQEPHSKDGKKLFGTAEALRIARVSSPRISPDASRVAYLVAENHAEKDKDTPWKFVTNLWVVPTAGPSTAARQFTRGEKSVSNLDWSPDGKLLAFTMDAGEEKDAKPQVWFMYADGGEPWQVTKHKSGARGFQFSPDGKTLLLTATIASSDAEEKRTKQKDDALVVDHDPKMSQLSPPATKSNSRMKTTPSATPAGPPTARISPSRPILRRASTTSASKPPGSWTQPAAARAS